MFVVAIGLILSILILATLSFLKNHLSGNEIFDKIIWFAGDLKPMAIFHLIGLIIFSVISTLYAGIAITVAAKIFSDSELNFLDSSLAAIIGNIASIVPLTPGGIGFGELGYQKTIETASSVVEEQMDATPYFIFRILNIFMSLVMILLFSFAFWRSKIIKKKWNTEPQ